MTHHRGAAVAAGIALLAMLAGCADDGGGTAAPAPTSPAATAGTETPQSTDGPKNADQPEDTAQPEGDDAPDDTASGSPAPPASPGGTGRCHTSELTAAVGRNDPGAGQENFPIVVTNRSGHACTIYGYPGTAFVDAAGRQVAPDPERTTGWPKRTVTLAPGDSAWAGMSFGNPEVTGATTVTPAAMLVTPPDETTSLKVSWRGGPVPKAGTASAVRLNPFQPGEGP